MEVMPVVSGGGPRPNRDMTILQDNMSHADGL
jgi:hypothetical protein